MEDSLAVILHEISPDETNGSLVKRLAACIVTLMDLLQGFSDAPVVFELEDVDVSSYEYLQVTPSLIAVMLRYDRRTAQYRHQIRHGTVSLFLNVLIWKILQKRAHTLHEIIRSFFGKIHVEKNKLEWTEGILDVRHVEGQQLLIKFLLHLAVGVAFILQR